MWVFRFILAVLFLSFGTLQAQWDEDGIPVEEPINIDGLSEGTTGDTVGDTTGNTKDSPGLHLGETPGAPAAPGQNDSTIPPGQENKPDKPDKPNPKKP